MENKKITITIDYPKNKTYTEILKFIVRVMDGDEPHYSFIVGLFSYCLTNDGLTKKQIKALAPYLSYYDIGE